jgi:predicted GNAT family acetyltransferase
LALQQQKQQQQQQQQYLTIIPFCSETLNNQKHSTSNFKNVANLTIYIK